MWFAFGRLQDFEKEGIGQKMNVKSKISKF
jgi:hypothetical protein